MFDIHTTDPKYVFYHDAIFLGYTTIDYIYGLKQIVVTKGGKLQSVSGRRYRYTYDRNYLTIKRAPKKQKIQYRVMCGRQHGLIESIPFDVSGSAPISLSLLPFLASTTMIGGYQFGALDFDPLPFGDRPLPPNAYLVMARTLAEDVTFYSGMNLSSRKIDIITDWIEIPKLLRDTLSENLWKLLYKFFESPGLQAIKDKYSSLCR